VLHHLLRLIDNLRLGRLIWTSKQAEQSRAIEKDVDVTRAGNLHALDFVELFQTWFEFFGDCAWRLFLTGGLFDQFCELESDREGEIAELRARRGLGCELLHFDAKNLLRRGTDSLSKFLL
jgi:hypothetical protein